MKILLLGEFSALHKNLKEGLVDLGHQVTIAAHGDEYKNIPCDISFASGLVGGLGKIHHRLIPFLKLKKLIQYDIVQLVNPFIFTERFFPAKFFLKTIIKNNNKFFLSAAGSDAYYWKYGRSMLKYGPFSDFLKYDLKSATSPFELKGAFDFNKWLVDQSNGVIPIMFEYEKSYEDCPKRLNTIPIPMNLNKIKYRENEVKNKLVIFHGLSRYGFKGTRHVEKAFDYLKKKYPNDLELIIEGQIPLNDYLELLERTNVVVDQMYSYSLGVNGVYSLAMGKIVMGGAESESLRSLGVEKSPVINLKPNPQSIINEVEKLLDERLYITEKGYESRRFCEEVHCNLKIAQKYIDTWIKS